jgi:hypothetical protein
MDSGEITVEVSAVAYKQSPKDAERDDPYCPLFDLLTNGTALELALAGRNTRRSIHRISAQLRGAATLRD